MRSQFSDIPQGLGSALLANSVALERYSALTEDERATIVAKAAGVTSKREMRQMVQELTMGSAPM